MARRWVAGFCVTAAALVLAVWLTPAWNLDASYYTFADGRAMAWIPNFLDLISNAPWLVIGVAGFWFARRNAVTRGGPFSEQWERSAAMVMFAGVAGIAAGSGYFHWAPSPETLFWDRLPMAVVFMALFALMIGDRVGPIAGRALFLPLLSFGVFSVLHWRWTEGAGRGDVRLYAVVQFLPMLAMPALLIFRQGRYTQGRMLWMCLGWYAAAKLFELADERVFLLGGVVSGHTLKHLAGAAAALAILNWVRTRTRVPCAGEV